MAGAGGVREGGNVAYLPSSLVYQTEEPFRVGLGGSVAKNPSGKGVGGLEH
jgi:hypothetical protein